jgi:hypothetical protein
MTNIGNFAVFKPVPGGYVYRKPTIWLFGVSEHVQVNEAQKAAIVAVITAASPAVLGATALAWVACSLLIGAALWWLAGQGGDGAAGFAAAVAVAATVLAIYPAFVLSRQLLLRRLRPVIAGLPRSDEPITVADERRLLAAALAGGAKPVLSPARRKLLRLCGGVMFLSTLGAMIGRAADLPGAYDSKLAAFYAANANLSGLNLVFIIALSVFLMLFAERVFGKK